MTDGAPQVSRPWYESAFQNGYLARYPHRSDAQAREEAGFIARALALPPGARVLDLCCGAGRHSRALAAAGLNVTGLDLSQDLLSAAIAHPARPQPQYMRGDMRHLPFGDGAFDGVVNLFTSFGYFLEESENERVICEVARVLRPGGTFVFDFLNLAPTIRGLVAESVREVNGTRLLERRWYDAARKRLCKSVEASDDNPEHRVDESVRAYSPAELVHLLKESGLAVVAQAGSLNGEPYDESASPRCVLVARR